MNAKTEGQKRAVLDMIYQAWVQQPELRLGQLIVNVSSLRGDSGADSAVDWLYNVKDFELVKEL